MGVYRSFKYILNSTSVAEANSLNLERPPQLEPQTRIEDTIIQVSCSVGFGETFFFLFIK